MAVNKFEDVLFAALQKEQAKEPISPQQSLSILKELCKGVEESPGGKVLCRLERGYLVNDGQEWRPMIQATGGGPSYVLLRAYVPSSGWPAKLSLYDGPMKRCETEGELRSKLEDFLKGPSVVEQIRYLMTGP